ncbi:MAG: hypothetical protein PHD01_13360 [Geobacteraceae bacterium]|nr:hypothetical protein [Geobacteraceae bacterium]
MKPSNSMRITSGSAMVLLLALLLMSQGVVQAQVTPKLPLGQMRFYEIPPLKLCPDLKVSLTVVKGRSGLVTLQGTVTNIGKGDYDMPSEAQVIMNLRYPPKTYAQIGVSDILLTKRFTKVKKGASFPVTCTFQIPDFQGWVIAGGKGNAKRLFTLRVMKQDMSSYEPGEDCHPEDNSKSVELESREKLP